MFTRTHRLHVIALQKQQRFLDGPVDLQVSPPLPPPHPRIRFEFAPPHARHLCSLVSSQWSQRVPITFTGLPPPGLCWSCLSVWDETASSSLLMGGLDALGSPTANTWLLT